MTNRPDPKLPRAEETSAADDASPEESEIPGVDESAADLGGSLGLITAKFTEALQLLGAVAAEIGIDLELRPTQRDGGPDRAHRAPTGLFAKLEAQDQALRALREENVALARNMEQRFQELAYLTTLLEVARKGGQPSTPARATTSAEDRAEAARQSARAEDTRPQPSTLHIADLTVASWATTALLNHVAIEDAAGMRAKVWNFAGVDPGRFSWQVRRLQGVTAGLIENGAPSTGAMVFIYGIDTYRALLERDHKITSPTAILVSSRTEMAEATALLKGQSPLLRVLRTTTQLFPSSQEPAAGEWPVALRVGLHDQRKVPARTLPDADVGINLHGKAITKGVVNLLEQLQERLERPLLVLADDNNKSAVRKHAKNVVTVDKTRGFWNEFFASLKVFVDVSSTPEKIQVTAAVSQAIQRRKLVVLSCDRELTYPGALAIADKGRLIDFLVETLSSASLLDERTQEMAGAFQTYRGDDFHVGRIMRAWDGHPGAAV